MEEWSATRINVANYCKMRFYLNYCARPRAKQARLPALEKGTVLHEMIELFWVKNDGVKVPRFSSAEEFATKAKGKWMRNVIASENSKRPDRKIEWNSNQERYILGAQIHQICRRLYDYFIAEGPPLYTEHGFWFSYEQDGRRMAFRGYIDEIRLRDGKVILRDYKSMKPERMKEEKVDHDPQLTLYNVAVCALSRADPDFARSLGLEDIAHTFMGNPAFTSDRVHPEFFVLDSLIPQKDPGQTPHQVVFPSARNDAHFHALRRMIEITKNAVASGQIVYEPGVKCGFCPLKTPCLKLYDQVANELPQNPPKQLIFNFAAQSFMYRPPPIKKPKVSQKRFHWKKPK